VETDGSRHRIVVCGAVRLPASASFSDKLFEIHRALVELIAQCRPDSVAIENIFYATNVRSALRLGHARGIAMLAAAQAGLTVVEYTPAEIKRAVVGYGRAEKQQVQHMVKLLLGLSSVPLPHDAADALAVAICHVHSRASARAAADIRGAGVPGVGVRGAGAPGVGKVTSWRRYRPART